MSWFSKIGRSWGQIPFADPFEAWENPYNRYNYENPRERKKKDMTQDSLGMGTETHNPQEVSINGPNESQVNSLSSFYDIDSKLYEGEVMNEGPGHKPRSRTDDKGGPSVSDSTDVIGIEEDAMASYIFKNTPDDATTDEVKIKNFLRFQNRPSRKTNLNGQFVNIID